MMETSKLTGSVKLMILENKNKLISGTIKTSFLKLKSVLTYIKTHYVKKHVDVV